MNKGAILHKPTIADGQVASQVELNKVTDSKTSGPWTEVKESKKLYTLILKREQLGKWITPGKTYTFGGYKLTDEQKQEIVTLLADDGLSKDTMPDDVKFEGTYYHETSDSDTKLYSECGINPPKEYTRRKVVFQSNQTSPSFWVESHVLNEAGNRIDLALTLDSWKSYPLQKGKNTLPGKIGFNSLIANHETTEDTTDITRSMLAIDSNEARWHYLYSADEKGQAIEGWVKEEAPDITRHSPWEWPLFELIKETATPQQLIDRMSRGEKLDTADRTPLMLALYDIIDTDNSKTLTPTELQQALSTPWLAGLISRLAVNYESEWYADAALTKWNELDEWLKNTYWKDVLDYVKKTYLAYWLKDKTERIQKLLWWDKVGEQCGLSKDGKAWYLHPAGMVGNFGIETPKNESNYVIILDPGHGDKPKDSKYFDPGVVDGTAYEKNYALILATALKDVLSEEYTVYMTRDGDVEVDKRINWRWKFANEKKGNIFISFHLDSTNKEDVYAIRQENMGNEKDSEQLAYAILNELSSIVAVPENKVRNVKGYTRFNTLGVLKNFEGTAGILFEFGGIKSTILNKIDNRKVEIAQTIKKGIDEYVKATDSL